MKLPIKYLECGTRFITHDVEYWEVCTRTFLPQFNVVQCINQHNVIRDFNGDTLVGVDEWDLNTKPLNELKCGSKFIYNYRYWSLYATYLGKYEVMDLQDGEIQALNPNVIVYVLDEVR